MDSQSIYDEELIREKARQDLQALQSAPFYQGLAHGFKTGLIALGIMAAIGVGLAIIYWNQWCLVHKYCW